MYLPAQFAEEDPQRIAALVRDNPFATLISVADGAPVVSHVPLLAVPAPSGALSDGVLIGHLARANPHARMLEHGECTAIFHGPHAYVSPNWYNSPGVPTWNYAIVQIRGRIRQSTSVAETLNILTTLTAAFESSEPQAWAPNRIGARLEGLLDAIVAFSLHINEISAKFKLSQNRPKDEQEAIAKALEPRHGELAAFMREPPRRY